MEKSASLSPQGGISGAASPKYYTQEEIKAFRVEIDALTQKAKTLEFKANDYPLKSMAQKNVYESLLLAKMWLGKCLESLGSELPQEYRDKAES